MDRKLVFSPIGGLVLLCLAAALPGHAQSPAVPATQAVQAAMAQARQQMPLAGQQVAVAGGVAEQAVQQAPQLGQPLSPPGATGGAAGMAAPAPPAPPSAPMPVANPGLLDAAGGFVEQNGAGGAGGFGMGIAPGGAGMGGGIGGMDSGGIYSARQRDLGQPMILVRASDTSPTTLGEIQEDLTIMASILNKTVAEAVSANPPDTVMGIVVSALGGKERQIRSLYLDGYGALFFLEVPMPLLPPPAGSQEAVSKPSPPPSTWEQTRQELYGPHAGQNPRQFGFFGPAADRGLRWSGRQAGPRAMNVFPGGPPAVYDATKVETLKKRLIEALKNATNIRHLKPDEWITVAVTGATSQPAAVAGLRRLTLYLETPDGTPVPTHEKGEPVLNPPSAATLRNLRSTLVIRARKSDVDAFAKGKFNLDEFQRRASVVTY